MRCFSQPNNNSCGDFGEGLDDRFHGRVCLELRDWDGVLGCHSDVAYFSNDQSPNRFRTCINLAVSTPVLHKHFTATGRFQNHSFACDLNQITQRTFPLLTTGRRL